MKQRVPDRRTQRAEEQRSVRRRVILESALHLFAEKGYHATSITDIIERAGIARGTFYLYFENKRAIFEELLEGYLATIASVIRRITLDVGGPSPADQIRGNVERVFDVLSANRPLNRILLRQAVGIDDDFDRKLSAFYGRLVGLITGALVLGRQMGVIRDENPHVLAASILGSIKEVVNQFLLDAPDRPTIDRDEAILAILAYNLHGISRPA